MNIQLMSDLHLEHGDMPVPHTDADVVILAGDIHPGTKGLEWAKGFDKPVIYVAGNHEYYEHDIWKVDRDLFHEGWGTTVSFLQEGCQARIKVLDEEVVFIGATLWTDFNIFNDRVMAMLRCREGMNDYRLIKDGETLFTPEKAYELHQVHLENIKEAIKRIAPNRKIVMVTHHAPSERSFKKGLGGEHRLPAYVSNLEYMMDGRISLWVHGHVHVSNDYTINGTRVMSNPRGYMSTKKSRPQNENFNPNLVVEV